MRTAGTYVSAIGHTGLVIWLFVGWGFSSDPLPFEVTEMSVVSGEEYAALVAATSPNPGTADPTAPVVPDVEDAPETPAEDAVVEVPEPPALVDAPEVEVPPDAPELPEPPAPEIEVAPVVVAPEIQEAIPEPIIEEPPSPRDADIVTPDAVEPPEPDVAEDVTPEPAVVPDETAEPETVVDPVEPTVAPDTTTEIVTEADVPSGAVATTVRPSARPNRPAPTPDPEPETATAAAEPVEDTSVADALAEALAADQPAVSQGPPMTGSERDSFRVAVNKCWNVDPGSVAARVTIEVGFSLDREGKVTGDVRQLSSQGGDSGAVNTAFQAARRAILRCQSSGYKLPADKYEQWKDVVITFDPSGMRLR